MSVTFAYVYLYNMYQIRWFAVMNFEMKEKKNGSTCDELERSGWHLIKNFCERHIEYVSWMSSIT